MKLLSLVAAALIATTCVVGCDDQATTARFDTPKDAYTAFADAAKQGDWGVAASALNPDSQAMMAVSMAFGASIMAGADEDLNQSLKDLMAKHGIDMDAEPEEPSDPENYDPQKERLKLVQPVKNLPVFLGEIGAWMKSTGKDSPGGMAEMRELGDVKVTGETALAMCQTDMGPQSIGFVKENGGWLLDLMVEPTDEQLKDAGLESDNSDRNDPGLGAIYFGGQEVPLRHVLAYRSKFFDDPCIDVVLTAKPVHDRALKRLKRSLKEEGNGMGFFPDSPYIRLSIGNDGKLVDMFAWIDNISMGFTDLTEIDVQIDGNRIQGSAGSTEVKQVQDKDFEFIADFDTELMQVE